MNRCEAPNCKMRTYALTEEQMKLVKNNYVISFHKFPEDPDRRRSWINAAKKPSWKPPLFNSSLCSLHFRDDCFNENNELYDNAIPSIFFDDFRYHMKEIVEKLDLRYDDDASKQNSSLESNQSSAPLETEEEFNFVECEEVVIYEDNLNVNGIENISIPELDESSATTGNNALKLPVPVPKVDTSKVDTNNIVDIKIANTDASTSNPNDVDEILGIDPVEIIANSSTATNIISSGSLPKSASNISLPKTQLTNHSPNVTKQPLTTASVESNIQRSNSVSTASTASVWDYKPSGVSSKPASLSIPSNTAAKLAVPSSSIASISKPSAVQSPGASSIRITTLGSTWNNPQTKSSFASPRLSKPTNVSSSISTNTAGKPTSTPSTSVASKPTITSNEPVTVPSTNTAGKPTSTPSTSVASKPTITSNEPVTVPSTSRGKSTPSGTYSILEPATKSLVVQLLNIVKMANTSEVNKPKPGQTYSSYLVTSKCTETDSNELCEVVSSSTIIENIANYIRMIKNESFEKPKNVSVICGSPAIFLLKNITVEECDPNMNCVYVITTENLLQHLCRMKVKSNHDASSNQEQQPVEKSKTNAVTPNKPLLVADLVSSANPKAVVPIQNRFNSSPAVKNAAKPKTVSRLSNSGNKLPHNSVTPAGAAGAKQSAYVAKPTANSSLFCITEPRTLVNTPIVCITTAKPGANATPCSTGLTLPESNSTSSPTVAKPAVKSVPFSTKPSQSKNISTLPPTVAKPAAKSVSFCFEPNQLAYDPTSPLTAAKPASDSISSPIGPILPANNSISLSTSAKSGAKYSFIYTKNNSVLQCPPDRSSSNTYVPCTLSAKLPAIKLVSGSPASTYKAATAISANSTTVSKSVNYSNLSKTLKCSQTSTISSPIVKTISPVTPVTNAPSLIPDTPVARVIPTTIGATVTPSAQLSVETGSVNVYQKSQPILYQGTSSQLTSERFLLPMKPTTPSRTLIPTPATPVVIPSSSVSSVIRPQQSMLVQMPVGKSYSVFNSVKSQPQPSTSSSEPLAYIFQPIQPSNFDTNLKTSELLVSYDSFVMPKEPTPTIPSQSTVTASLKRKWGEIDNDDDDDDDDDPFFATCDDEDYNQQYLEHQKKEIENCESNILKKEREITNLKKRIQALKKRLTAVKNPHDTKTDEQLVEEILSKYLDSDGVQFFIGQMKVSGKTYTQFRWSEDDKLFALGLLYRNPAEYNALFQKYTLPSDKTLNKFVSKVKKAEMQESRSSNGK